MPMRLASSAFGQNEPIPVRFTCDGDNRPPPLTWSGAPATTRSYALVCRDPDAPGRTWYHWAAFDIPVAVQGLDGGAPPGATMRQAINDFRKRGYGGPCPPQGHGRHRYQFTLYALDVEHLDVPAGAECREVERAARARTLDSADLTGIYQR